MNQFPIKVVYRMSFELVHTAKYLPSFAYCKTSDSGRLEKGHLARNGGKGQVTFMDYLQMQRVPVISPDGRPLMPTKSSRAKRWLKEGKAKIYPNDLQVFAIQLVNEPFGFRSGDFVQAEKAGQIYRGWIGGYTETAKSKNVSIYDVNWKRIGQFSPNKVKLLKRSTKLCVA